MIVYIAGPITGNENHKEQFKTAQEHFEAQGDVVLNPASLPPGMKDKQYMKICVAMMEVANMVYFLEGWSESKGASFEYEWCKYHGKLMHFQLFDTTVESLKVILEVQG